MKADFLLSMSVIILSFMIIYSNVRIDQLCKRITKLENELLDNDLFILRLLAKNKSSNND